MAEEIKEGIQQLFGTTEMQTEYASMVGSLGDAKGPLEI